MTNAKGNPGAGHARATTGRTDRARSHSATSIAENVHLVKPKLVRYRRSTWAILGPMIDTARHLGLIHLVDDLLELGRSWQARGLAA